MNPTSRPNPHISINERMTATMEGPFCVFLIGMRFNKPWKIHKWLPFMREMPRMLAELERQPELGYLGGNVWFGRTAISVQYWRSFEALTDYARNPDRQHLPAWTRFRNRIGNSGDVGIWHETYRISEGQYETIYHNMPAFGLGQVGRLVSATGRRDSAARRMGARTSEGQGIQEKGD